VKRRERQREGVGAPKKISASGISASDRKSLVARASSEAP
jgi:hypothetical protein